MKLISTIKVFLLLLIDWSNLLHLHNALYFAFKQDKIMVCFYSDKLIFFGKSLIA